MAESKSFSDEFLSCAICYDIYTDPCTLFCGHSFCRACLTNYTKSNSEAIQANTLPCACCRAVTKVPRSSAPVEEWAGQISASLILKGLLDRYRSHAAVKRGKETCFLCNGVGETTQATSWCSDCKIKICSRCAKIHVKSPFAEKHKVVAFVNDEETKIEKTCKKHVDEEIKFFCKDCNMKACSKCCSGTHTSCQNVRKIDSMTSYIKSELGEIERQLLSKTSKFRNLENDQEERLEQLKTRALAIEAEIKSASATAVDLVKQKENDALEKLADTYYELKGQLQAGIKSCQISVQTYRQNTEFIQQALDSENIMNLVDTYQIWKSKSSESLGEPEEESRVGELKFSSNVEPLKKALKHMARIGITFPQKTEHICDSSEIVKVVQLDPLPDKEAERRCPTVTARFEKTLNIRHKDDTDDPIPADIEVVSVANSTKILVLDFNNKSLKSITNGHNISVLKLPGCPRRLTRLSSTSLAVSADHRIFLIEINSTLSLVSTINTPQDYWCICALSDSTLAAGSGSSIDILDLKGNVVRSLRPQNTTHLMKNPNYLSSTRCGNILATDSESKSVYCLSPSGKVIFSFPPVDRALEHPSGIAETINGDILFADWKSSKIIHLSPDGRFLRDILSADDDIDKPGSLCIDSDNKLYLCDGSLGNKCVKVFSLK